MSYFTSVRSLIQQMVPERLDDVNKMIDHWSRDKRKSAKAASPTLNIRKFAELKT